MTDRETPVLTVFDDLAMVQNRDYLLLPQNQTEHHEKIEEKAYELADKYCKENNVTESSRSLVLSSRMQDFKMRLISEWAQENERNAVRCPYELSQIRTVTELFSGKYDLKDPRAYVIVRALISNMLSAYRMQRYTDEAGPVIKYVDKQGNERSYLNPSEEAKRRYNDAVVDAVMKLDQIFEGSKSSIVMAQYTPKDFMKLFPRASDVTPVKVKSLNNSSTP